MTVYYGGPNGRRTSFLDRLFFSADGTKFRGMLAASVVSCRRGGATAAFERMNQYFLMTNMAYLLKAGETAENAGITKPEYEDVTLTNFIR